MVVSSNNDYKTAGIRKPGENLSTAFRDTKEKVKRTEGKSLGRWTNVVARFTGLKMSIYTVYFSQPG